MATIGTHYIKSALGGAKARGLDPRALLRMARIPERPLKDPKARIHVDHVAKLYYGIAKALNDEFMGFTERPIKLGTFAMMAEWASTAETLEDLLRRGIRFYNQITDELQMSLDYEGEHVYLTTVFKRPELDFEKYPARHYRQTGAGRICRHPRHVGLRKIHHPALHRRAAKTNGRQGTHPRQAAR